MIFRLNFGIKPLFILYIVNISFLLLIFKVLAVLDDENSSLLDLDSPLNRIYYLNYS